MAKMSTVNPSLLTTVVLIPVYISFLGLSATPATIHSASNGEAQADVITRKPYIVHMNNFMKPQPFSLHEHWYASLLREVSGLQFHPAQFLYMYNHAIHGFAASLTSAEAQALGSIDSCLAVIRSSFYHLHTTHSPEFLGLSHSSTKVSSELWSLSNYGDDVIVGVIDTGIWPESKSFNDAGLGPVPARWKGHCQTGVMFNSSHCNRKIIGARYFAAGWEAEHGKINISVDYRSPRDIKGHGTHCASTIAGSPAPWSNFSGFANGTAMGMAPRARLAIYKAGWISGEFNDADLIAAIDHAIADGVDVISMSVGSAEKEELTQYDLALFSATQKGIFLSMSAGNDGPFASTLGNTAPWVTTVGASSVDRAFPSPVSIGNLETYMGTSLYNGPGVENLTLVYASHNSSSMYCSPGSLHSNMVRDKIVLCDLFFPANDYTPLQQGAEVKRAGGAAMIIANSLVNGGDDSVIEFLNYIKGLPATLVSFWNGRKIKDYIKSTPTPTATIDLRGLTVVGRATRAPIVASFSSRGPSKLFPDVLKPDLIAPGLLVLAASTKGNYQIMSGSSMACPHVSGIAALIKAAHPSWSPAAIRSALMTSSYVRDNKRQLIKDFLNLRPATPFDMGAGHVNPAAAVDPGLIYDLKPQDYVDFLCNTNRTLNVAISLMKSLSCSKSTRTQGGDLNYPSFSVVFRSDGGLSLRRRTVTNVGGGNAVYRVAVRSPPHVRISVEPTTLTFEMHNEKLSYNVTFESKLNAGEHNEHEEFGWIIWKCIKGGQYTVQSPVAIMWNGTSA